MAALAAGPILARFGISPDAFLDSGSQSEVFALGADRILRVFREAADPAQLRRLKAFLAGIDGRLAVATPSIQEINPAGAFTVERRLPGKSLLRRLPALAGARRATALRNFITGAGTVATVTLPDRPYGHVLAPDPIHAETWTGFLRASLDRAIDRNGPAIGGEAGDVAALRAVALRLLEGVPEHPAKALIHGDYFPGNVLMDDGLAVSGLVDFSGYTMAGDPLYDALTAPIFLEMIGDATEEDVALAHALVGDRHDTAAAAFYRAHAAFWMADPALALPPYPGLYPWAIANLRRLAASDPAGTPAGRSGTASRRTRR